MRPAKEFRYIVPTREGVAERMELLIAGQMSRDEIADWAKEFIFYDNPQIYPEVSDLVVFDMLTTLSGADSPSTDREFLYGEEDFVAWLSELRTKIKNKCYR